MPFKDFDAIIIRMHYLTKSDSKDISSPNKCGFELSIYQKNMKKVSQFHQNIKQHNCFEH